MELSGLLAILDAERGALRADEQTKERVFDGLERGGLHARRFYPDSRMKLSHAWPGLVHPRTVVTSRPPGPLDDSLRAELEGLEREVAEACPPYRMSRRAVTVPVHWPRSIRWFWEVFGQSALSQRYAAPDDPSARLAAIGVLRAWCDDDVRYETLVPLVEGGHHVIAFDDEELVLVTHGLARLEEDPPLVVLRGPTGAAEGPELQPLATSALRYLVTGVLKGLWSELVRVLLVSRPPIELEQPFSRLAPQVGRASVADAKVWVAERDVRARAGFAMYFSHADAERVSQWISQQGLDDQTLV